jgi:hypothetical protein
MQNPETGKFCRSCGTDLGTVSDALAGKSSDKPQVFGTIKPSHHEKLVNRRGRPVSWDSALGKLFMGMAFFAVSIILGFTGAGQGWWYWMLIPAFVMLGSGIAQIVQIKSSQQGVLPVSGNSRDEISAKQDFPDRVSAGSQNTALPPTQTEFVAPESSRYQTGDLVPPSVTDGTTRHLELDKEGKTMTLPKMEK